MIDKLLKLLINFLFFAYKYTYLEYQTGGEKFKINIWYCEKKFWKEKIFLSWIVEDSLFSLEMFDYAPTQIKFL